MTESTQIFFLLTVIVLVSELLAPVTGSLLMERFGANLCFLFGILAYLLVFGILWFIPETSKSSQSSGDSLPSTAESAELLKHGSGISQKLVDLVDHIRTDLLPLLSRGTLVLGMLSLLVNYFALPVFNILMQYMTIRFEWKYSQVRIH